MTDEAVLAGTVGGRVIFVEFKRVGLSVPIIEGGATAGCDGETLAVVVMTAPSAKFRLFSRKQSSLLGIAT